MSVKKSKASEQAVYLAVSKEELRDDFGLKLTPLSVAESEAKELLHENGVSEMYVLKLTKVYRKKIETEVIVEEV